MSREPKAIPEHGRKANQKMKPYLVMEYLMRQTDENHAESADNIVAYLQELGIDAERRSIYRDIDEINKALWLLENADDDATMFVFCSFFFDRCHLFFLSAVRKEETVNLLLSICCPSPKC